MATIRRFFQGSGRDPSRRNVIVLGLALALAMTGSSLIMTVSALAGQMLAADKRLATLPLALQFALTMVATIPASYLMRRIGRRAGFSIGQGIGLLAAVIAAYGIFRGSFALFAVGSAMFGIHNAFWQYYRFAAADTASPEFRSRAISLVLSGGVVAAVSGPELAKWSRDLFAAAPFAGSYAMIVVLCIGAIAVLQFIRIPPPSLAQLGDSGRPLRLIAGQPVFFVAVLVAMVGYGVMSLVMTATPLAMIGNRHAFDDAAFIIQWHALGMFAPSFFSGHLIRRFGVLNVILAGIVMNLASVAINLTGMGMIQFWSALVLLGIGWNFMFVGATTMLTEAYTPAERAKAQGLNDVLVFAAVTVAGFSSGALHNAFGWEAVNYGVIVPVVLTLLAILWLRGVRRRGETAVPE